MADTKKSQYDIEYAKKNLKRIPLDVQKEKYEEIKAAAKAAGEPVNGYIKKAIDYTMCKFNLSYSHFQSWYLTSSPEEKILLEKVEDFSDCFNDMLFEIDSLTDNFIRCESQLSNGQWIEDTVCRPDSLECFSYSCFRYKVAVQSDCGGYYNPITQELCVTPENLTNDAVILHEMIHLHEHVINDLPLYYHDTLLFALYTDLKGKISDLDGIVSSHAHILNEQECLYRVGGLHDILFLLKSFDLDIRMGYPLGTVFGYNYAETMEHDNTPDKK